MEGFLSKRGFLPQRAHVKTTNGEVIMSSVTGFVWEYKQGPPLSLWGN